MAYLHRVQDRGLGKVQKSKECTNRKKKEMEWISGEKDIDKREEERKESLVEVSQTFLSTLIKKF